jgi:hypothetical protein
VQAERDQMRHALLAHVAERHRRAWWMLGVHFVNDAEPLASPVMASVILANLSFASAKRVYRQPSRNGRPALIRDGSLRKRCFLFR